MPDISVVLLDLVLIETLWNVNLIPAAILFPQPCFNRNIVECKCYNSLVSVCEIIVLIETLWNVNSHLVPALDDRLLF